MRVNAAMFSGDSDFDSDTIQDHSSNKYTSTSQAHLLTVTLHDGLVSYDKQSKFGFIIL